MPLEVGRAAIERAFRALDLCGGLNVSFFGGEPLLESARILEWMAYARRRSEVQEKQVRFNLTTNGTLTGRDAWRVIMSDDLDVAVSFDGVPELHDRHRRTAQGLGSAATMKATLERY